MASEGDGHGETAVRREENEGRGGTCRAGQWCIGGSREEDRPKQDVFFFSLSELLIQLLLLSREKEHGRGFENTTQHNEWAGVFGINSTQNLGLCLCFFHEGGSTDRSFFSAFSLSASLFFLTVLVFLLLSRC